MRFGMGILLTEEEDILAPVTKLRFAALGLAKNYYSLDIKSKQCHEESPHKDNPTMANAVWLYKTWEASRLPKQSRRLVNSCAI